MRAGGTSTLILVLGALAAGCGGEEEPTPGAPPPATTTAAGGGDDRPAPPVGDGDGGVELEQVGSFEQPVHVTQAAGDEEHLFVVEQCGRVVRTPISGGEGETFLDIGELVTCGGEQGLLSVAFSPDHERDGLLYVYFTDLEGDQRVVEYRRAAGGETADPASARELLRIEDFAPNHNGGLLVFGPDGHLYIGSGDGGGAGDPERTAQDLGSLLGKILRIDPRTSGNQPYSIPERNPHFGEPGVREEVLIHGLRNPWRFSFDRETDDLWIGDVGQSSLEEIDFASARELGGELDFGWSAFEGTQPFNEDQEARAARPPVLEYGREAGCSVTGGMVVRDPALRPLYGRYLYGDFCQGELRSFAPVPSSAAAGAQARDDRPLGVQVPSLSSFGEDLQGRVYAVSLEGAVHRLVPSGG